MQQKHMQFSESVGFPLVVRPSYVLGGRAMEVVYKKSDLENYLVEAVQASAKSPVLLDGFLNQATEMDIEAVCDGEEVVIGGILQHIEQAGIHSGDSACSLPPYSLSKDLIEEITHMVKKISFTGSTEVGKILIEQSASTVKKISMELGGDRKSVV